MSEEYGYVVEVAGAETFANLMSNQGIIVQSVGTRLVEFKSEKLIDMKSLKTKGVVRAYKIVKIERTERLIEEG
jgi:hypothetical protein